MNNSLSIIIPVYNEKDSLEELYGEIRNATGSFSKREILFIDDGSTDGSTEILKTMAEEYSDVILIQFYRNYGKAAALAEGFNHSTGDYIVTMDADLQDDPLEINSLYEKLKLNYLGNKSIEIKNIDVLKDSLFFKSNFNIIAF